jgi:hypothetical protein
MSDRFTGELWQGIVGIYRAILAPPLFKVMPRRRLEGLTSMAMNSEDKKAGAGAVTMRQLSPTLRYEGLLLAELAGTIAAFTDVPAGVLLMGGASPSSPGSKPRVDNLQALSVVFTERANPATGGPPTGHIRNFRPSSPTSAQTSGPATTAAAMPRHRPALARPHCADRRSAATSGRGTRHRRTAAAWDS